MDNRIEIANKKEWATPELKKVDIAEVTALSSGSPTVDGAFTS